MSNSVPHKIKTVVFDFEYPSDAAAFRARQEFREMLEQRLVPALERVLDEAGLRNRITSIPKIEIDLGLVDLDNLDAEEWAGKVARCVLRQAALSLVPGEDGRSMGDDLEETLLTFLEHGTWRWQSSFDGTRELEASLIFLDEDRASRLVSRMFGLLERTNVRLRIAYQFGSEFVEWIVRYLQPIIWRQILEISNSYLGLPSTPKRRTFLLRLAVELAPDTQVEELDHQIRHEVELAFDLNEPQHPEDRDERPFPGGQDIDDLVDSTFSDRQATDGLTLYTQAAGIVILHPFIARFFENMGLMSGRDTFRSDRAKARAIHLLHFLATGKTSPEEHETHLYKLLCGYPLGAPVIRDLPISIEEREACVELLTAVVEHWKKLKRTSPDGLRETFLERQGRLHRDNSGWHLVIEHRHVDVLLEYLPWPVAVVRLPWMNDPVWIDWG